MTQDTKLLLVIAGALTCGAIGLAVLGTWSARESAELAREPTVGFEATPASYTLESSNGRPARDVPALATLPAPVNAPEEFRVEPGADFVKRGMQAWSEREFDEAAAYFAAEAEARPRRSWTHYMLGLSLWKDGRAEQAAEEMTHAAELDASSVKARINLSRIQNDRREFTAALEAARDALALSPEDPEALFVAARCLYNLGNEREAIEVLEQSLAGEPDNGYAQNLLGLALLETGRESEALAALLRAVELNPGVAFIHNNLGMALERNGRRSEAVEAYRLAVASDPSHEKAGRNLARLEAAGPGTETAPAGTAVAAVPVSAGGDVP